MATKALSPLALTLSDLAEEKRRADAALARQRENEEKKVSAFSTGATAVEVSATAFLFGLAQGKWGGFAIKGIPLDLVTAIAAHAIAFSQEGKLSSHLHAVGDGAFASFFAGLGREVGRSIQTPKDMARATTSSGIGGSGDITGGGGLADDELARMIASK